jgi:O-antigen ligase
VQQPDQLADIAFDPVVRAGTVVAGLSVGLLLVAPRLAPLLLLLLAAPALAYALPTSIRQEDLGRSPQVLALLFAGYLFINSIWSLVRPEAFGKSLLFTAIVLLVWFCRRGLVRLPGQLIERAARLWAGGFVAGLAFLLVEEAAGHPIKRALFNVLPFLRPSEKHVRVEADLVSSLELYLSNRNMAALVLALWPLLLVIVTGIGAWTARGAANKRWLAAALVIGAVTLTLANSQHETSLLALIASGLVCALAYWSRRIAQGLVALAWLIATLAVVPIVTYAYEGLQLHQQQALPKSARARIIIWGYTAEQIPKAPLGGIGIGSGKVMDERGGHETPPGHMFPRRPGTHSHNIYVQTWYELGAVGAVLLCAMGLGLLAGIGRLEEQIQPFALAAFVTAAVTAGFSYGMWQPWFMTSFGISAVLLLAAAEWARRVRTTSSQ